MPGVRLNLSKSGVSASLGRGGAWFTVEPRELRATVGIPGTGIRIEVPPALPPRTVDAAPARSAAAPAGDSAAEGRVEDSRLVRGALAVAAIVAVGALAWALSV
jgi:hypothetical protein